MSIHDSKHRLSVTLMFTALVFLVLLVTMLLVVTAILVFIRMGILQLGENTPNIKGLLIIMGLVSVLLGTALAATAGNVPLRPVNVLINAMNRLAAGDFKTRLELPARYQPITAAKELTDSFNTMAEQLENTELLRSDFINNFSHEFKTPIVSIAGFAKLLRKGKLSTEEQQEYLGIIETEALRLSAIATNVLNLSRVENQSILTDVEEYNLSEQLRSCVLLLERKWASKQLELNLELGEHSITANEELMKQVWVNLLDNAVKFTPEFGTVEVAVTETDSVTTVKITNTGSEIPPEKQERIFRKFYQADESHAGEGNGLGLAIVKKITDLHNGRVTVESTGELTAFSVELPKTGKR